jgi:hypothetical protein
VNEQWQDCVGSGSTGRGKNVEGLRKANVILMAGEGSRYLVAMSVLPREIRDYTTQTY